MLLHSNREKKPDSVLVYVEEFNRSEGIVLFDFIDSDEFRLFLNSINLDYDLKEPSMVLLRNYKGREIRDNTIYAIQRRTILSWRQEDIQESDTLNSFLIGFRIDVSDTDQSIFKKSFSPSFLEKYYSHNFFMTGRGNVPNVPIQYSGRISAVVRNVGQGNWNEVCFNDNVKIVFDAGAPMTATKEEIKKFIGNRSSLYPDSKPILILSHWDKDHYHALIGMSDSELNDSFSAFVCRDFVPNQTSRMLFDRIKIAVGTENTYCIPADRRGSGRGAIVLRPLTNIEDQVVLFNSEYHKNRNVSGMVVTVKTKDGSVILSGDVHYNQISKFVLPSLNYRHSHNLVVPHHGGKAGKYTYRMPFGVKLSNAIISVGANSYHHPLESYVNALTASGFVVRQTKLASDEIKLIL
jgi:hypothetical protein